MKCDERPNGCANCQRLGLDCVGLSSASPSSASAGDGADPASPVAIRLTRTKRTYRSCGSCRVSKTKCDGQRPKCSRCRARSTQCVYSTGPEPRWALDLSRPSISPPQESPVTLTEVPADPATPRPNGAATVGPSSAIYEQEDAGQQSAPLPTISSTIPHGDGPSETHSQAREPATSDPLSW